MAARSEDVIDFIEAALVNTKGKFAGRPFKLYDFQRDAIEAILAQNPRTGKRLTREFLLGVARKNGKTELIAALAIALLVLDGEPGGDVVIAAGKRDQARILLTAAQKMVRLGKLGGVPLDAARGGWLDVRRDHIYFPEMDAKLGAVSADAQNEQGLNPNVAIVDELHVAAEKNRDLYDALMTAQGARENPLMVAITTAGPMPTGPCYDLYAYGKEIERGVRSDPDFRMIWHEAEPEAEVDDPRAWAAANPALDKFLFREFLKKAARAVLAGKAPEYAFRRLHLNQWTTAAERWLPYAKWKACSGMPSIPEGSDVFVALDASLSRDSFGVAWVYVTTERRFVGRENGLTVPEDVKVAHVQVKEFRPLHDGAYIDPQDVLMFLLGLQRLYNVVDLSYDPAYMGLLASALQDRGFPTEPFPQSADRMTRATETLQRLTLDERLRHGGDKILDSHMAAVGVKPTDRGVRISKAKSGRYVDCATALAMALDRALGDETEAEDFALLA